MVCPRNHHFQQVLRLNRSVEVKEERSLFQHLGTFKLFGYCLGTSFALRKRTAYSVISARSLISGAGRHRRFCGFPSLFTIIFQTSTTLCFRRSSLIRRFSKVPTSNNTPGEILSLMNRENLIGLSKKSSLSASSPTEPFCRSQRGKIPLSASWYF